MVRLVQRDPTRWSDLARTFNEMADWMQRSTGLESQRAEGESDLASAWAPSVDIYDQGDRLVVQAELPGVKKDDIDIRVEDGVLMLSGKRERQKEVKEEGYYRCERCYGNFGRTFRLPSNVASDKIDASFKDGILTIAMPKAEEAKPKRIQVK
jgi:HSP20 family protein